METRYGKVAVLAVESHTGAPRERWTAAATHCFPQSPSSQKKGCPRGAFLGLCEEGLIKNIEAGRYTTSINNKRYALRASELLRSGRVFAKPIDLWLAVMDGKKKAHNGQADVVMALWQKGLLA